MVEPDERLAPAPPEPATSPSATEEGRTGWRALAVDLGPLRRHRDFRLLVASRAVSFFGSMITFVAVPYQTFRLTRSSFAVGALGAAELACLLSSAFLGGALADAVDRRRLVLACEAALGLCSGALLANAALTHPHVWVLFAAAGAIAGLTGLQRPALEALVPRLVESHELSSASAISSLQGTAAMILGPALAGLLIAGPGLPATFAVDVATFVLSLVALAAMQAAPPPPGAERPTVARVLEGFRYARSRQELIGSYLVDMGAMFFGMPMALFPAIASRHGGAGALGAIYAAPSAGAFVATVTSGWTSRVHRHGQAIVAAATIWGAAIVVFGLAGPLWLALAALVLAGAADMVSGIFRMTMWNRTIPDALRGRLASIELVSYTSGPLLGNTEAGAAAALFGVRASVVSGGALCVAAVLVTSAALPAFRAYDDRRGEPPA